ncbi:MAG: hypothetical protein AAF567_11095 [Actinomycetota bacterium]
MTIAVLGAGLVGRRTAELLARDHGDVMLASRGQAGESIPGVELLRGIDHPRDLRPLRAAVLAGPSFLQVELAEELLDLGVPVVSTADHPDAVRELWNLAGKALASGTPLIVGAACSPGLSSLLVAQLARRFDRIDAITTARFGTGGPACAREHHRSMAAVAWEVEDGQSRTTRGGSGRGLVWFPEPVGAQDCYQAGLAEPFLLHQAHPDVPRIRALQAATRRDRATARLPMLRKPHAEGLLGAVWAEVRGKLREDRGGGIEHAVMAATAPQATAAAAVAAAATVELLGDASFAPGAHTLGAVVEPARLLRRVGDQVRLWTHSGEIVVRPGSSGPVRAARKWRGGSEFSPIRPIRAGDPFEQADLPKVNRLATD